MEDPAHGRQRRLRFTIPGSDAEHPILHLRSAAEPLVCPGINKGARAARKERSANLPIQRLRLSGFAITKSVQAHLRHDQRPVTGKVVQAGEIGIEAFMRFEIDVEAGKIQERKLKIFGGWIIDVGHKAVRVLRFRSEIEPFQETFQFAPAMPPNDGSRDFVANAVAKKRRMAGTGADFGAHHRFDRTGAGTRSCGRISQREFHAN